MSFWTQVTFHIPLSASGGVCALSCLAFSPLDLLELQKPTLISVTHTNAVNFLASGWTLQLLWNTLGFFQEWFDV